MYVYKYTGTDDGSTVKDHTQIQDMLFMENRDRTYDSDIYVIRGIYNVQDIDFDLSQFGLFLSNDTLFLTVHMNSSVKTIGRKLMSGDVFELPHLADDYAANDAPIAVKRFYVVEEVTTASEGYSPTWYPHLYRVKLKKLTDTQEFSTILDRPADEGTALTLRDLLSDYAKVSQVNAAVLSEAEANAPRSGYETRQFYTMSVDESGRARLQTIDETQYDASSSLTVDAVYDSPLREGYSGYLLGDAYGINGAPFGSGIIFPQTAAEGDYFLRTDFMPQRLYRFDATRWVKVHDVVRETLSNTRTRNTQLASFFNNADRYTYTGVVASDYVKILDSGIYVVATRLAAEHVTARYLMLKLYDTDGIPVTELSYELADYPDMLTVNGDYLTLRLPVIDDQQLEFAQGIWRVQLANNRESERQSLSTALRPKADL